MCDQVETVVLLLHEKSLGDTTLVVSVVYISVHAKKPCNCNSSTVKCVRMIGLEISLCQCNRTVFPWASRKWIQRNQEIRTPNSPEPIDILTTSWQGSNNHPWWCVFFAWTRMTCVSLTPIKHTNPSWFIIQELDGKVRTVPMVIIRWLFFLFLLVVAISQMVVVISYSSVIASWY